MKKTVLPVCIILLAMVVADFLSYWCMFHFDNPAWTGPVMFLINVLLIFILFQTILYGKAYTLKSNRILVFILILAPLFLAGMAADRLRAIGKFYYYSKTLTKNTSGHLFRFDDSLSYTGVPGCCGTYNYYIGDSVTGSVPVCFDSLGFRTKPGNLQARDTATDLFLGCSFTFGDFVPAELTWPFLVTQKLGHGCINGGVSGYGAGQMVQITDRLVPRRHFRYVFIQLTGWLTDRAMDLNGPTRYGYRPFPYFSDDGQAFHLNLPAYSTLMYSGRNWRKAPCSYWEKLKFTIIDGAKIEVHDYYAWRLAWLSARLGLRPAPTGRKKELELYVYEYIADKCLRNGAIPVFLKVSYPSDECDSLVARLRQKATVIDIDSALSAVALSRGMKPARLFHIYHVQGRDSVQYDAHPNKLAHSVYANAILNRLTPEGKRQTSKVNQKEK